MASMQGHNVVSGRDASPGICVPRVPYWRRVVGFSVCATGYLVLAAAIAIRILPDPAYDEIGITEMRCLVFAVALGFASVFAKNWYGALPGAIAVAAIPFAVMYPPSGDASQWIFPVPINCMYVNSGRAAAANAARNVRTVSEPSSTDTSAPTTSTLLGWRSRDPDACRCVIRSSGLVCLTHSAYFRKGELPIKMAIDDPLPP